MLHCTSSQSLVDSNLLVAERPIGQYGKGRLRNGGRSFHLATETSKFSRRPQGTRGGREGGGGGGGGGQLQRATLIISCSGWARQRRQTSTCRLRPAARSPPRCPSALWEGSAGGSSDPVVGDKKKERTVQRKAPQISFWDMKTLMWRCESTTVVERKGGKKKYIFQKQISKSL